jgi:hypothetical protein
MPMSLTTAQGAIWKQIAQVYLQWDPTRNKLMPVRELAENLPAVAPDLIGDTLAQAAAEDMAEVAHVGEDPSFRPLQH